VQLPSGAYEHRITPRKKLLLWRSGTEIQQILNGLRPDVVIERYYNFAGEGMLRANVPSILEVNSPLLEYPGSLKTKTDVLLMGTMKRRRDLIAQKASMILSPIKEIIPEEFRGKVKEVEWGADTELFDPERFPDKNELRKARGYGPNDILLVHFGSLRAWHGVDILQQAFRHTRDTLGLGVKCLIIGPAKQSSNDGLIFTGSIPHQELPSWLKMCDLAVLPFALENHRYLELGFFWSPLKLFEAMAMDLPIVTRDHPRLRSILGIKNSDYYYDGTGADLFEKIIAALSRQRDSLYLRDRVLKEFSWQAHGDHLDAWIRELAG